MPLTPHATCVDRIWPHGWDAGAPATEAGRLGWLAFVASALVLGGAVGTKTLTTADSQVGESGHAARLYAGAGLDSGDGESVLVQSRSLHASDPTFIATVRSVERVRRSSRASATSARHSAEAAAASRETAIRR